MFYLVWVFRKVFKKKGYLSVVWKVESRVGRCGKESGVRLRFFEGVVGEEESICFIFIDCVVCIRVYVGFLGDRDGRVKEGICG